MFTDDVDHRLAVHPDRAEARKARWVSRLLSVLRGGKVGKITRRTMVVGLKPYLSKMEPQVGVRR
jgi:hypothetical protein